MPNYLVATASPHRFVDEFKLPSASIAYAKLLRCFSDDHAYRLVSVDGGPECAVVYRQHEGFSMPILVTTDKRDAADLVDYLKTFGQRPHVMSFMAPMPVRFL